MKIVNVHEYHAYDKNNLSRRRPLSYRNQSIDLRSKSLDWFLHDNGLRLERVNAEYVNGGTFPQ